MGGAGGGLPVLRRVPDHALDGSGRVDEPRTAQAGRQVHPDGGRDLQHGGDHRRLGGRAARHDGDERAGFLADAGEHRLRGHDRDPVRGGERAARRTFDRPADAAFAGGRDAGALGYARRPPDHRAGAGVGAGSLRPDPESLRPGREVPHAGDPAGGRDHRAHARAGGPAGLGEREDGGLPGSSQGREGWGIQTLRQRCGGRAAAGELRDGLPLPHHRVGPQRTGLLDPAPGPYRPVAGALQ